MNFLVKNVKIVFHICRNISDKMKIAYFFQDQIYVGVIIRLIGANFVHAVTRRHSLTIRAGTLTFLIALCCIALCEPTTQILY